MSAEGWDCHAHLFGPYDQYPLSADRNYTPPEAVEQQYMALLARLGLGHGVLVHPSAYGMDHSLVLAALAARPQLRGVLVAQPDTLPTLRGLRDKGVRGLRFSQRGTAANFPGSASFDDLLAMAPALADAGLHAELWTDRTVLPSLADAIRQLPVPVVIDHMCGFDPVAGVAEPGFQCLLSLLAEGRVWVKLCAYRNLFSVAGGMGPWLEALTPIQQALQQANPSQLVWGSDWPHLNVKTPTDAAELLALLRASVDDAEVVEQILVRNPSALYL